MSDGYIINPEIADRLLELAAANVPWSRPTPRPLTRWERLRAMPRRLKWRAIAAIHDRFFGSYCSNWDD